MLRFFFYGTLMAGSGNPVADRIHDRLRELGPAVATGRLFAIATRQGWYPALLADPAGAAVHGIAYEALPGFTDEDLALLDRYEAYDRDRLAASEYWREPIPVACGGCEHLAEAYVYRAALPRGAQPVPHGDFRRFLAETGAAAYRAAPEEIGSALARLRRR
jgi:gamma-glutamylcyclotransferase (GGCT)/AIG2-like uncharacterized protein YtfP